MRLTIKISTGHFVMSHAVTAVPPSPMTLPTWNSRTVRLSAADTAAFGSCVGLSGARPSPVAAGSRVRSCAVVATALPPSSLGRRDAAQYEADRERRQCGRRNRVLFRLRLRLRRGLSRRRGWTGCALATAALCERVPLGRNRPLHVVELLVRSRPDIGLLRQRRGGVAQIPTRLVDLAPE